jgi:hypothetical protein
MICSKPQAKLKLHVPFRCCPKLAGATASFGGTHDLPSVVDLVICGCIVDRSDVDGLRSVWRWRRRWRLRGWHRRRQRLRRFRHEWRRFHERHNGRRDQRCSRQFNEFNDRRRRLDPAVQWRAEFERPNRRHADAPNHPARHDWFSRQRWQRQFRRSQAGARRWRFSRKPDRFGQYRTGNRKRAASSGRERQGDQDNLRPMLIDGATIGLTMRSKRPRRLRS